MKIGDLLSPDRILLDFSAPDKWVAIERLVDHLVGLGAVPSASRRHVADALFAREKVASTGLEHGVAIPHAAADGVEEPAAAVAISRKGVEFESQDGKPATILILLVIPRRLVGRHMRTLASIAKLLESEAMRREFRESKTPAAIIEAIRREETPKAGSTKTSKEAAEGGGTAGD